MAEYKVLLGMNYGPDNTRVEAGDILPDSFAAPAKVDWAVSVGAIELVGDPASVAPAADPEATLVPAVLLTPAVIVEPAIIVVPAAEPVPAVLPTTTPANEAQGDTEAPGAAMEVN